MLFFDGSISFSHKKSWQISTMWKFLLVKTLSCKNPFCEVRIKFDKTII